MSQRKPPPQKPFIKRHGLSLIVMAILALWLILYVVSDPSTHIGAFYGNAIADWTGTLLIVVATKYFYERGSKESRSPAHHYHSRFREFLEWHSLTIVLLVTGVAWAILYARMDSEGKAGQVVGNIVSEWTQVLGLVVITKYAGEMGSKEGS
jgi:hypothetical protein